MRAVVQRVSQASVSVDRSTVGRIDSGLLLYLGISADDTDADLDALTSKTAGLRIFEDEHGSMNLSVVDVQGSALVISQFTLYGDARRGRRPSFIAAMEPGRAEPMYKRFIERLVSHKVPCQRGVFGAMMEVHSVNDGPVTILLDSKKLF